MGVNQDPIYQAFFGAETEVGTVKVIKTWIHPQKVACYYFHKYILYKTTFTDHIIFFLYLRHIYYVTETEQNPAVLPPSMPFVCGKT